jgi:hypothetical protein
MPELPEHHSRSSHAGPRERPLSWTAFRGGIRYGWLVPILFLDWLMQWTAFAMSRFSLLEVLEYCGSFSILIAVIFYFLDAPERTKTRHYQAWQVINTAQGKGGSGGRTDALQELNEDHVPLVGVDVFNAFLQGVHLEHADLLRSNFRSADMRNADLSGASLEHADFGFVNLRNGNLTQVKFTDANLEDADLNGANLTGAQFRGVTFERADLRGVNLAAVSQWDAIKSIKLADIHAVQNPPDGFVAWALKNGAVDIESDEEWSKLFPAVPAASNP